MCGREIDGCYAYYHIIPLPELISSITQQEFLVVFFFSFSFFQLHHVACEILVPDQDQTCTPAIEAAVFAAGWPEKSRDFFKFSEMALL